MRCAQVDSYVERFADGALEIAMARRIEAHLRSCARCTSRVEMARALISGFEAPLDRAPPGFAARVMEAVYREALSKSPETRPSRIPARTYRRLGLSFVFAAGVLAASLFIPQVAYPVLFGTGSAAEGFSREGSAAVQSALNGADSVVRGILREPVNGGSVQ